jgi:hypothetical protein
LYPIISQYTCLAIQTPAQNTKPVVREIDVIIVALFILFNISTSSFSLYAREIMRFLDKNHSRGIFEKSKKDGAM